MNRPILIVLTPVFNEAWILPAFLKATSLWADYIIIADQMSTDGTREIIADFAKRQSDVLCMMSDVLDDYTKHHHCEVIMIDNPRKEMHQAATRRLLFEEAKKIKGDKILFTLDADEFLSGDFPKTEGWKTIMNSEPGDVFCFRWMNLSADATKYSTWQPYYWALHVDKDSFNGEFPDNFIHEWRLPWPTQEKHVYTIDDICFIHFARVNKIRQRNKARFYQISQSAAVDKYSGISFYRMYHPVVDEVLYDVPEDAYAFYRNHNLNLYANINLDDSGQHYTDGVLRRIHEKGIRYFHKLDIWDEDFLRQEKLVDPRTWFDKLVHKYLRRTNKWAKSFFVHVVDYLMKKVY